MKRSDAGTILLCRMDNGAVFRIWGLMLSSVHRTRYELHGDRGMVGTAEADHWGMVKVHHESWLRGADQKRDLLYRPEWPGHADMAAKAGHGGGDFWTCHYFAEAIRTGQRPYLDCYRATAMASVSIQGWRSCLDQGRPYPIPDFRDEAQRQLYAGDHWNPYPDSGYQPRPPVSIAGEPEPSPAAVARAEKVWAKKGR